MQSLFTKSGGSSLWGWPAHRNPKPHGFGLSSTWCGSKRPSCACPAGLVCERHASGTARRRLDLVFVKIRSIAIDADRCIPCIPWKLSSYSFCGLVSRMGGWDTKIFQWQSLFTKSRGSSLWGWPAHRNPKPHGFWLSSTWPVSKGRPLRVPPAWCV